MRKLRIKREFGRIVVTQSSLYWVMTVFVSMFVGIGISALIDLSKEVLLFDGWEDAVGSTIGLSFIIILTSIVFLLAYGIWSMTYTVTLDQQGVHEKPFLPIRKQLSYQWSNIVDWGLSYDGRDRSGEQLFTLYFSPRLLKTNQKGNRKKLKRKYIKMTVYEIDYHRIIEEIYPLATQYTDVVPFDGTNVQ